MALRLYRRRARWAVIRGELRLMANGRLITSPERLINWDAALRLSGSKNVQAGTGSDLPLQRTTLGPKWPAYPDKFNV